MKDAKGHGSEAHGGGVARAVKAPAYDGQPTWHGVMPNGQKVTNSAGNKLSYASPEAAVAGATWQHGRSLASRNPIQNSGGVPASGGQPVTSNAHAAATLAGGQKSAPVDTHPAMVTWDVASRGNNGELVHEGTRTGPRSVLRNYRP